MSLNDFLHETAAAAGQELASRQGTKLKVAYKPDTSLVTEADLASEKVIIERIQRYFPDDLIYSEESGLSAGRRQPGGHIWVIDPLDGTTNYANGYPFYCVSIGRGTFQADGTIEITAGCVLDAARGRFYHASRGEGAFVDGVPLRVAPPRDFSKCFLVTGFYYWQGNDLQAEIGRFSRVAEKCQSIRRDGAAALDLAFVAEGIFDGFWERGLQPWDVAAGSLLVSEAGGLVLNYDRIPSNPYNIEAVGLIAGSPGAAEAIASLL